MMFLQVLFFIAQFWGGAARASCPPGSTFKDKTYPSSIPITYSWQLLDERTGQIINDQVESVVIKDETREIPMLLQGAQFVAQQTIGGVEPQTRNGAIIWTTKDGERFECKAVWSFRPGLI